MDPDSDPGGPKTRGSGAGSGTLIERKNQLNIHRPRVWTLAWTGKAAARRRAACDLPLPSHPVNTSTAYPPARREEDRFSKSILSNRVVDPH